MLDATALVSVDELKDSMGGMAGNARDQALERAINAASSIIQTHLGRTLCDSSLVTPWERTEYHTIDGHINELWLMDWPIVSITSVHVDTSRAYGAGTLVDVADYSIDKPNGRLLWHSGLGGWSYGWGWGYGFEAVRVVGVLGYRAQNGLPAAAEAVPSDIKDACLWVASRLYQEGERKQFDVSSVTDATGSVTRFSGSRLPPMIAERLVSHRARTGTGRRAA